MPVKIGQQIPEPVEPTADLVPDVVTSDGKPLPIAAMFSLEQLLEFPANFDALPLEEQERIKARYRFLGIRMRHDIKDRTIPISRDTVDIP